MTYRYVVPGRVDRYISRMEKARARQVAERLRQLTQDPYNAAISKPLHGRLAGQRSSDLGGLRIIYEVDDTIRVLDVIDIGPRGDIYKR